MRCFGFSHDYVLFGMTGAESWVWYNWAMENEMTMFGASYRRRTPGYIKQEANKLIEIANKAKRKKK